MIGEGLAESHRYSEFVSIGIISLNRVGSANELIAMASATQQDELTSSRTPKTKTYYGVKENPLNDDITFLDHNHSNFILIDDEESNTDTALEHEVLFRVKLEREFRNGWTPFVPHLERLNNGGDSERHSLSSLASNETSIPSILVCLNGQYESLLLVKESLREKVSVLVLAGTKGCADLIANALIYDSPK